MKIRLNKIRVAQKELMKNLRCDILSETEKLVTERIESIRNFFEKEINFLLDEFQTSSIALVNQRREIQKLLKTNFDQERVITQLKIFLTRVVNYHSINEHKIHLGDNIEDKIYDNRVERYEVICYNLLKCDKDPLWEYKNLSLQGQFYSNQEQVENLKERIRQLEKEMYTYKAENIAFRNFSEMLEQTEKKNRKESSELQMNLKNTIEKRIATIESQKNKIETLSKELKTIHKNYQHKESFYKGEIQIYKQIKEKLENQKADLESEIKQIKTILKYPRLYSKYKDKTFDEMKDFHGESVVLDRSENDLCIDDTYHTKNPRDSLNYTPMTRRFNRCKSKQKYSILNKNHKNNVSACTSNSMLRSGTRLTKRTVFCRLETAGKIRPSTQNRDRTISKDQAINL